jgi:hypothetical protein
MKKLILFFLPFLSLTSFVFAQSQDWKTSKGTHFIVYYKNANEDFISELMNKAESYYNRIADGLGFRRFDFWIWDNRAKLYIYDDAQGYHSATGQPSWSLGSVLPKDKIIQTFVGAKEFFDTTLPHEMGHIIFREFVGFDNPAIPIWLDEGVASFQEYSQLSIADSVVREAIKQNKLIKLGGLSGFDLRSFLDQNSVNLFYSEALSIVNFLMKKFGQNNFVFFCQNLRDKRDLTTAIASSFPFKDIHELNDAWYKYLKNE